MFAAAVTEEAETREGGLLGLLEDGGGRIEWAGHKPRRED